MYVASEINDYFNVPFTSIRPNSIFANLNAEQNVRARGQ